MKCPPGRWVVPTDQSYSMTPSLMLMYIMEDSCTATQNPSYTQEMCNISDRKIVVLRSAQIALYDGDFLSTMIPGFSVGWAGNEWFVCT